MVRFLAVAALLVVAVPSHLAAQCSQAEKVALEALDKTWGEASERGDRAYLENLYAAGYTGLGGAQPQDRATVIANAVRDAEANRANPEPQATMNHYQIACTSNTAVITHRVMVPAAAGSTNAPFYSRAIHVLEKTGGQWKVVSSTGHPLGDAGILAYMEMDWNEAWKKRDAEWARANYANNATEVSSLTGKLQTKAQSIESFKTDKNTYESLQLSDMNVRVNGDMAVVTGVNHVKGKDGAGKAIDLRVRFTDTFVKRDGRWMVLATQGTEIK